MIEKYLPNHSPEFFNSLFPWPLRSNIAPIILTAYVALLLDLVVFVSPQLVGGAAEEAFNERSIGVFVIFGFVQKMNSVEVIRQNILEAILGRVRGGNSAVVGGGKGQNK